MSTNRNAVLEYAADKNWKMAVPCAAAKGTAEEPGCGDTLEVAFAAKRDIITAIWYNITESACPPAHACAAAACSLAKGRPVIEAYLITSVDIAGLLSDDGRLDAEHIHCAMMAELALKRAVRDYSIKKKSAREGERMAVI